MPILELQAVSKHFGGLPAVDDVSFDVTEGRVLAVIGPNGAGKSTLLKAVSGMHQPTSGTILFDGDDITGLTSHEIRQRGIAKVLQHPRVFHSMSVRDNAALGAMFGTPGGRRSEADALRAGDDALALVGLDDKADWPVDQLNLHQQRTLDLARAIAGSPRVLLLDEVMAGLNPGELEDSIAIVRRLGDELGLTVVWVEHVMRAVRALADEVVVLNMGRLLADGEPDVVMRDPRVVEAYLGEGATSA
ncbi:ABC transporter ATP-binding protein [Salsipaludibacter albus]|uniref:ABC transporter ATP-binding protein n=1 Tax=Salsipaludibacter albus TaxID=2849650 RepID=UPI001EE3A58D|nr:ABC transporter ATP-binding protein [Salsipaludibacter albus]MBY5164459.1 ABC transporter ATP-binding protein [Salsipaludibacter albus]